jgi:hypothetical protein
MNFDSRMVASMMVGLLLGVAIGVTLNNLGLWMSTGFAVGVFYWMIRYQHS